MAEKDVYLSGKAKWVKTSQPNKFGDWSLDLYPLPESLTIVKDMKAQGLKNALKRDADGDGDFMTFKRPTQKVIRGKLQGFAPPLVVEEDGKTPLTVYVGNGSDVTICLEVYGPGNKNGGWGIASRLKSIKVHNLVPFTGNIDFDADQQKQMAKLADQPAPTF